jgi:four helix bundle protein
MDDNRQVSPEKLFAVERLDVFRVAVSLVRLLDPLGPRLWKRNSSLWRQLQRALASVVANVGEAAGCLSRPDRRRYFEYAYRSASECAALVITLDAIGALDPSETATARQLLHRTQIMLIRLIQRARRE